MNLVALELSMALTRPDTPKTFCTASRRDRRGFVVASCSFHPGHEGDHRDVHAGVTWA